MYIFKKERKKDFLKGTKISYIAEEVGITQSFLTQILNGNKHCSKLVAYCIVKFMNNDYEINDFFEKEN